MCPTNLLGCNRKHLIQLSGEARAQSIDVFYVKNTLHVRVLVNSPPQFVPFQVEVQLSNHSKVCIRLFFLSVVFQRLMVIDVLKLLSLCFHYISIRQIQKKYKKMHLFLLMGDFSL